METRRKKVLKEIAVEAKANHRLNNLGVVGWFYGGHYKIERYLYTAHRFTGLFLLLFFGIHLVGATFFRIQGQSTWQTLTSLYEQPVYQAVLIFFLIVIIFHAVNGLRLILLELGFGMGKPQRPIYPYRDSLRRKQGYAILTMVVIMALLVIFLLNFVVRA